MSAARGRLTMRGGGGPREASGAGGATRGEYNFLNEDQARICNAKQIMKFVGQ